MTGAGLYDDDTAADLKAQIALISKIPVSGDRLLGILLEGRGLGPSLDDEGGPTYWLALADQFERRGIRSAVVVELALEAIQSGADLADLSDRGMSAQGLAKRAKLHAELSARLQHPRPERKTPKNPRAPHSVVRAGEVYVFPTMAGLAFASYINSIADLDKANFKPDGWGAIVVLSQGRAYDWLPWCSIASIAVDPTHVPTVSDLLDCELIYHSQSKGATRCIPQRRELKDVEFQKIGSLELRDDVEQRVRAWPEVPQSIEYGWRMRTAAFGQNCRFRLPRGPKLATLLS